MIKGIKQAGRTMRFLYSSNAPTPAPPAMSKPAVGGARLGIQWLARNTERRRKPNWMRSPPCVVTAPRPALPQPSGTKPYAKPLSANAPCSGTSEWRGQGLARPGTHSRRFGIGPGHMRRKRCPTMGDRPRCSGEPAGCCCVSRGKPARDCERLRTRWLMVRESVWRA